MRASYGSSIDHPHLVLYFLGDASDGSNSGQLVLRGAVQYVIGPLVPAA